MFVYNSVVARQRSYKCTLYVFAPVCYHFHGAEKALYDDCNGFAIAYKLSDNNLIVAYFVNLPNAFVTYMLKYNQFPTMKFSSTIAAIITVILIMLILKFINSFEDSNSR